MPHVPRCLVDDLSADAVRLPDDARRHLVRVLRMRAGETLELVDGRGGLARAELLDDGRARVLERAPRASPPADALTLAVAPPRLPRLEWLVEKACELGVAELVLLRTEHAERLPGDGRLGRLQRLSDEALLQCRRLLRMPVRAPVPLQALLAAPRAGALWLGVPPGDASDQTPGSAPGSAPARAPRRDGPVLGLVGPEGGWSPAEEALVLASGAVPVTLGRTVLRVETAAVALAVLAAV